MSNFSGKVTSSIAGVQLTLVMDYNAICEFEGIMGTSAMDRFEAMETGGGSFSDVRALLWAVSREHHSDMTIMDVGRLIGKDMAGAQEALAKVQEAAQPEPEHTEDEPVKKKPARRKSAAGRR